MIVTDTIDDDQAKLVIAQPPDQDIGRIQVVEDDPLIVQVLFQARFRRRSRH